MSRKLTLAPYKVIDAGSMGTTLTSTVTNIQYLDNVGVQLNFTTSDAVGTFQVQVSMDYTQDAVGNVLNAGNWINLTLNPSPVAASAANQIYIDINQVSAPYMRVKYTRTSGTGTLTAYITGKML